MIDICLATMRQVSAMERRRQEARLLRDIGAALPLIVAVVHPVVRGLLHTLLHTIHWRFNQEPRPVLLMITV